MQTADGIQIVSAGETTVLGGKLRGEHLEVGDRLAIVFLGEKEGENGRTYKNWEVGSEKAANPTADNGAPPLDDNIPF